MELFRTASPEALAAVQDEKRVRKTDELFLLFPMGSQFDHLIVQALARLGVYCLVADPATCAAADVKALAPTGIILSGGPASVHSEPPPFDSAIFDLGIPTLGICLGFQMWAKHIGCRVVPGDLKEYGIHPVAVLASEGILAGFAEDRPAHVLQSHGDVVYMDPRLRVLGMPIAGPTQAVSAASYGHLHGVQFHPEVTDTVRGDEYFANFCFGVCQAKDRYPAEDVATRKIVELREQMGGKKVLLALSGGSDSSVVAHLLGRAVGFHTGVIRGIYIRGIDRPDDEAFVHEYFGNLPWLELVVVDATDRFLDALAGKLTMHEKRVAMRGVYHPVLEEQAADFGASFFAQGTLYTDISESGGGLGGGARKARIKLHHNTGLPFSLPEITPLDDCVKDNARNIGRSIGVPEALLVRHPFPGPGLVVRIEGEITAEKLAMARQLDGIYIEELRGAGLYGTVWKAGVTVTQSVHTCTKGDGNAEGLLVCPWAVWSVNGFTARAAELAWSFMKTVSRRFGNEVAGVGAVAWRVSDKPFSTVEWG